MKMITKEYLEELSPHKPMRQNYHKYYDGWSGTLEEFLYLDKIGQSYKRWVFFNSIPKEKLGLVTADLVERVLHIYENECHNDNRARKAMEVARRNDRAEAANYADYADHASTCDFDDDDDDDGDEYGVADAAADILAAACAAAYSASNAGDDSDIAAADAATEYALSAATHLMAIEADATGSDDYFDNYRKEERAQIEIMKKHILEVK